VAQNSQNSYSSKPMLIRPGGLLLFYNAEGPLSLQAMTPKEIPKDLVPAKSEEVFAKGCQHGLSIPLSLAIRRQSLSGAWGKAGMGKAILKLKKEQPEIVGLYDVKIDMHTTSILGIYTRQCVEITGRGLLRLF
jgi:hypothetical protein